MTTRIFYRKKFPRPVMAFVFTLIFVFYSIFSLPLFNTTAMAGTAGALSEGWRFTAGTAGQWQNGNTQVTTEAEGEWVPFQIQLTQLQESYPNLTGFVFEVEFSFTNNGSRFFDAIRSVQISENVSALDTLNAAYPDGNGNAMDLSSRAGIEAAQNNAESYYWDNPVGTTDTGFIPIEFGKDVPLTQLNVPMADDTTGKTIDGVPGFSFDDDTHRFYVTGDQLIALGINPTAENLVMYFQIHFARTSVWNEGSMKYLADSRADLGCWMYDDELFSTNTCNGAGIANGASAHISLGPSTPIGNSQIQFPPLGAPTGSISGYKWDDVNADGLWNLNGVDGILNTADDEKPLVNWPVTLTGNFGGIYVPLNTVYTDANGMYIFVNLTNDVTYFVNEAPGAIEMRQTYPEFGKNPTSDTNPAAPVVPGVSAFDVEGDPPVTPVEATTYDPTATSQEMAAFLQYALSVGFEGIYEAIDWSKWAWKVNLPFDPNGDGTLSQSNLNFGNTVTPPSIEITKVAAPDSIPETGGDVTYTFELKNTGLTPVTVTTLSDDKLGNLLDAAKAAWLQSGKTGDIILGIEAGVNDTFSFTYVVTMSTAGLIGTTDVAEHTNTVTVEVIDKNEKTAQDTATETVGITNVMPEVDLTKAAKTESISDPGGMFEFTLTVENKSAEEVVITSLVDDNAPIGTDAYTEVQSLVGQKLAVGESKSVTYTISHTFADVYENTAVVIVTDNEGSTDTDEATATVSVINVLPDITITKTAAPESLADPGGEFIFTIVVTNNGVEPVTVTAFDDTNKAEMNDEELEALEAMVGKTIGVGDHIDLTYSISHILTGEYSNTASVTVVDDEQSSLTKDVTEIVTVVEELPDISITKIAAPESLADPGGEFIYTIEITNNGPEPVTVTAFDDTNKAELDTEELAAFNAVIGQTIEPQGTIGVTYSISRILAGEYLNTASVTVVDDEQNDVTVDADATVTVIDQLPNITVTKVAEPDTIADPGGEFIYTIEVTNNGSEPVTITAIEDTNEAELDAQELAALNAMVGKTIEAGATIDLTYSISYILAGEYPNTVSVTAADDEDNSTGPVEAEEIVTVGQVPPDISITKIAAPESLADPGGEFIYTIEITNNGPEPVTVTAFDDTNKAELDTEELAAFNAVIGQTIEPQGTIGVTYSISRILAGEYLNTASVTVVDDEGVSITANADAAVTVVDQLPNITITKVVAPESLADPGGEFIYTIQITNNGSEPVTITAIEDTNIAELDTEELAAFNAVVGQTIEPQGMIEVTYTISRILAGEYLNTASVTVVDDEQNEVTEDATATATVNEILPLIDIEKTAKDITAPGDIVGTFEFTLTITNTGAEDVTITELTDTGLVPATIFESYIGTVLAPTDELIITYTLTDLASGDYTNTASVSAIDDEANPATDTDTALIFVPIIEPIIVSPDITVTKTASPTTLADPGGEFIFTITIKNNGLDTLTITEFSDTNAAELDTVELAALDAMVGKTIEAGETIDLTYTISHILAGEYSNTASVTVMDKDENVATEEATAIVTVSDILPLIDIEKIGTDVTVPGAGAGATFDFVLTIKNIGTEDVTITALTDSSTVPATVFEPYIGTVLPPNAILTITYTLTNLQPGDYANTASVTVTDDEGNPAIDTDTVIIFVPIVEPLIVGPETGDSSRADLLAILMTSSAMLMFAITKKRFRFNKEEK